MAFERLEVRVRPPVEKSPASIGLSMWGARRSGKPIVIVSLREDIVEQAGFSPSSVFNVLIGTGDDEGKLRLQQDPAGIVSARVFKTTKAFFINLGYVEQIGSEPARKTPTEARVISPGTVEVDIPEFEFEPLVKLLPPPAKPPEKPAARNEPAAKRTPELPGETHHGVTINLNEDEESVTFAGKTICISQQEAQLVKLLARPRPSPVAESFLIKNLWGSNKPKKPEEVIRSLCGELQKALKPIGLILAPVKGVGYQLKDA